MKTKLGKRLLALAMSILMTFTIVVQGDFVIGGVDKVDAAEITIDLRDYRVVGSGFVGSSTSSAGTATYSGKAITYKTIKVLTYDDITETNPLSSSYYTVSYTNNVNAGKATVTITGNEEAGCTGTLTTTFEIGSKSIDGRAIYIDGKAYAASANREFEYAKGGLELPIKVKDGTKTLTEGTDYTYTFWNCSDVGEGDPDYPMYGPHLRVYGEANYKDEVYRALTIVAADMSKQNMALKASSFVYTGQEIKPEVIITDVQSGLALEEGVDYTVSYSNNINAGEGTVTVTGIDNYTGTQSATFRILESGSDTKDIEDAVVTVAPCDYTGSAIKPDITVTYEGQTLTEGTDYSISTYSNNVNAGDGASLTVAGLGNYIGSKTVNFTISKRDVSKLTVTPTSPTYNYGSRVIAQVTIKDEEYGRKLTSGTDYSLDFDVNEDWNVGENKFVVTCKGNYTGTKEFTYTISQLSLAAATVSAADQEYTGSAIEPTSVVTLGGRTLVEGTDYEVTGYSNNIQPGSAIIYIKGINNYTGTAKGNFSITSTMPNLSDATISGISAQTYTGSQIKPDFTVTYANENGETVTLVKDVDYTVEYGENLKPTTGGTVKIVGNGTTYVGSQTAKFTINRKSIKSSDIVLNMPKTVYEYTGEVIYPEFTLEWNDYTLALGTDYRMVAFSTDDMLSQGEHSIAVYGDNLFEGYLIVKYTIQGPQGALGDVVLEELPDYEYTGSGICPELNMTLDGYKLVEGTDYEVVEYKNNTEVGTATIHIQGIGTFSGEKYINFNITKKDVANCDITLARTWFNYTGNAISPGITAKNGDTLMVLDTDYTKKLSDNIEAGKATVTITGKGNYTGTCELYFTINKISVTSTSVKITPVSGDYDYTGTAVTPAIEVKFDGQTLVEGTHYELTYENNVNLSTSTSKASVTVTGIGSFDGSYTQNYTIVKRNITKCYIDAIYNQAWTGEAVEPDVVVRSHGEGSTPLVEGVDYTLEYQDNVDEGIATVIITGIGNYTGTDSRTFVISKTLYDLNDEGVVISSVENQVYNFGIEIRPEIVITYDNEPLVEDTDYTVAYANNINAGTATITVTGKGIYSGERVINFTIAPADMSDALVSGMDAEVQYTGEAVTFDLVVKLGKATLVENKDYTVSYKNNTEVSTADSKAEIVVTGKGNYKGSVTAGFTITRRALSKCNIEPIAVQKYTKLPVCPEVVVTDGNKTLVKDTDYTVEYSNNIEATTEASKAKVVVTGIGNYTGDLTAEFEIEKDLIDIANAVIQPIGNQKYSFGNELKPDVTVTYSDEALTEGVDYELTYSNNIHAGTATVTVKGINDYKGTKTANFTITPIDVSGAYIDGELKETYSPAGINVNITSFNVEVDGVIHEITDMDSFEIALKDCDKAGNGTVIISAKDNANYEGSFEADIIIDAASIENGELTLDKSEYEFTGGAVTPDVTVTVDEVTLVKGTDYDVSYENNTAVGEATVTVTGKGNYTGTLSDKFTITPISIASATVTADDVTYTGSPLNTTIKVVLGDVTLVEGVDYTVSYDENTIVEAGTASFEITGINDYFGLKAGSFRILAKSIEACQVDGVQDATYQGQPITYDITVSDGSYTLVEGKDYTVVYANNTNAGTAAVTISGKGNYKGSIGKEFTIGKLSIEAGTLNIAGESYEYTGKQITPAITNITCADGSVIENVKLAAGLTVTYGENIHTGKGSVTVSAEAGGNYEGTVTAEFDITKKDISDAVVVVEDAAYTGSAITPEYSIVLNGYNLTEDDYTVTCYNNTDISSETNKPYIVIEGKGDFTGSITKGFSITAESLANAEIQVEGTYTYDGTAKIPTYEVVIGNKTLAAGRDYDAAYENNIDVGEAVIRITGTGNYSGTKTATFTIARKNISAYQISGVSDMTYTGNQITFDITVGNDIETLVKDTDYTVSYSNNINVTTDDSKAAVTVTGKGNYTGTITQKFDILGVSLEDVDVTGVEDSAVYTGVGIRFAGLKLVYGQYTLVNGFDYTVEYTNNTNVSTEGNPATLTIKGAGSFTGTLSYQFVITPKSLADCSVGNIEGQLYTGSALTPEIVIKDGSYTLVKGKDYEVSYSNNIEVTEEGNPAAAVITGKGNYEGDVTREFTISYKVIDISGAEIQLVSGDTYEYNYGLAIEPEIKVMLEKNELTADKDYTVSYTNNISAGVAAVTITGKREYKGTVSKTFTISPVDISDGRLELETDTFVYTGQAMKPAVQNIIVDAEGIHSVAVSDGFTVSYSNNTAAGTGTVTVTAKSGTNYTGSLTAEFTISAVDIVSAEIAVADQTYTGNALTPAVTVQLNGTMLVQYVDYTVIYSDNTDVGTANVTITGAGNYTGTATGSFEITARNIGTSIVTAESQVYTGKTITPEITVMNGSRKLTENKDYTVVITNNIDKGTALIEISGIGNYVGTVTGSFEITAKDIADCEISDIASVTYTGKEQTPAITVASESETLVLSKDYTVAYADNVRVTTTARKAKAVITGKGNYTGSVTKTFDITAADITAATVSGIPEKIQYTGKEIEASGLTVMLGDIQLTENSDYVLSYTNNKEVGTATVTITGAGDYQGVIEKTFEITTKDIADCQIEAISGQKYTGSQIKPEPMVKNGQLVLALGTDYELAYANNTDVTAAAEVIITGKGNYEGSVTVYFTISKDIVDINKADVSPVANQTYNFGAALTPSPVITYGNETLVLGTDYTVSYENNVNAGTAEITITGTGFYSGTRTESFEILPYSVEDGIIVLDADTYTYTGKNITPTVSGIVIPGKETITDLSGFDISYSNNKNVGSDAEVTVTAKAGTNYTGTRKASFEITAMSVSAADITVADAAYTGEKLMPTVTVTVNGVVLTEGTDYDTLYENNVNVGTAKLTVIGKGNYTGSISETFKITEKSIADAVVAVENQAYTGKAITPEVTVTLGDKQLVNGTDYTVAYSDNINVGNAVVVVTGKGNYKDTVSETFKITAKNMVDAEVSPIAAETYTGTAITPVVTVHDASGAVLTAGLDYDVAYANNVNATTADSKAVAVITGKGNYAGSITAEFEILPASMNQAVVSGYSQLVTYTGTEITFADITVSVNGNILDAEDYQVSYTGNTYPAGDGETYFTVTGKGNYTGSVTCYFQIARKDLSECTADEIEGQLWTGKAITPVVTVRNGSVILDIGTDYEVSYENNINETTQTSKAKAVITGKGYYTGTITKEFVISRVLTDISKTSIAKIADQTYNFGKEIRPEVVVTYEGKTLVKNVDYKLEYTDNVNVGLATVKITGVGSYNNSTEVPFNITKADISDAVATLRETSVVYTGSAITPSVTRLTIGNNVISDMSAFDVAYSDNTNVGTATVEITARADSNYSGTVTAEFEITGKSIASAYMTVMPAEYTGQPIVPEVTVTLDGKQLVADKDYMISCQNNTDVTANASVVITGKGNYTGSISGTFEITAKSIEGISVHIPDQGYTGMAMKPGVQLTIGGYTLKENEDYTVSYSNNINVTTADSKAVATIKGINNFTGRLTVNFDITAKDISKLSISGIEAQEYTGNAITPSVTIKDGKVTLVAGRDYDITYSNNTSITTEAKAVITGKGNYAGTATVTFEICETSIAGGAVTGVGKSAVYTGAEITFDDIVVVYGGNKLTKDVDYTVSYENNINVTTDSSKAYAVIKGKGNFGGEIRCEFDITPKDISTCTIGDIAGQVYTGQAVTPKVTIKNGNAILTEGTDYTLSYENNVALTTDSSKAKVIITGKGNYTGTASKEFTIAKEIVDISNAKISAIADQYYNFGAALEPDVEVTYNGRTLEKDEDYTVSYSNNKAVGSATVTINAIGANSGTVSGSFKILPIDITDGTASLASETVSYTGAELKPAVTGLTVSREGKLISVSDMSAFDISYKSNIEVGTATVTITAKKGKGFAGTISTTFEITEASISGAKLKVEDAAYTGLAVIPDVTVTLNGKTLTKGVDYTVSAANNVDVTSDAVVTITGCGSYTGTITGSFAITAKNIADCAVSDIAGTEYTGEAVTPDVTVKNGTVILARGTDYTVAYENNVNVSDSAKVIITGTGNYTGSVTKTFEIAKRSIAQAVISGLSGAVYSGNEVTFDNISVQLDGKTLTENVDYTVSYNHNIDATEKAEVIITGAGNYTGTAKTEFVISPLNIETTAVVSGIPQEKIYTGKAITLTGVKVMQGTKELVLGTDYQLSYANNMNVTTDGNPAECMITFTGNYTGSIKKSFAIVPCSIETGKIAAIANQGYTGSEVTPKLTITVNGNKLGENDYTAEYSNNIDIGTASVVVTGKGNYTGTLETTFTIVPAKVTGLTFVYTSSTTGSVKVSWNQLAGADGYYVYKYDMASKAYKLAGTVSAADYTLSGLVAGTSYKVAVSAYITLPDGSKLEGVKSEVNTSTLPAKVTGFKSTARTDTSITLAWSKVTGATGYRIYRYDTAAKKYVAVKTLTGTSLKVSGLKGGTDYKFKINAYRTVDGKTLWSADTTGSFTTAVSAVKGLKLVKRGTNSITFKWSKVSGADGYYIYKYNAKTRKYVKIKDITNAATTKFVSTGLKAGADYAYRVCAYKKSGNTKITGRLATFKNTTLPSNPIVKLKAKTKSAVIRWNRVYGASGYQIYMSTKKNGKYTKVATVKSGKKVRYTKKKLKSGKTYYFKVRAYKTYKGKKVYSSYSTIKKIKVK